MSSQPYNYDTFRREQMKGHTNFHAGPEPGQMAYDFDLPTVDGGRFCLREFRGVRPVLIEFGSIT